MSDADSVVPERCDAHLDTGEQCMFEKGHDWPHRYLKWVEDRGEPMPYVSRDMP